MHYMLTACQQRPNQTFYTSFPEFPLKWITPTPTKIVAGPSINHVGFVAYQPTQRGGHLPPPPQDVKYFWLAFILHLYAEGFLTI